MFDQVLKAAIQRKPFCVFLGLWVSFKISFQEDNDKRIILGSSLTDFKSQIENLPKLLPDYEIIAWDPPGQGKSIPPKRNFTMDFIEEDADTVKELMDALGVSTYSVLGWSNGATCGMILAGKHPKTVEKLVIFGAIAYLTSSEIKIYQYCRDVSNWSDKLRKPKEELYGFEYLKKKYNENVDTMEAIFKERNGDLCKKYLKHIKAETLILHGRKDLLVSEEHIPYLLNNILDVSLVTFPNGSHDIHLNFSDEFNRKVVDFLAK